MDKELREKIPKLEAQVRALDRKIQWAVALLWLSLALQVAVGLSKSLGGP